MNASLRTGKGCGRLQYSLQMSFDAEYPFVFTALYVGTTAPSFGPSLDPLAGATAFGSRGHFRISDSPNFCSQGTSVAVRANDESAE
jgi:hypothetical protein